MKVKIGDTIYDAKDQPIMLILNSKDKENIKNMHEEATMFCEYPNGSDKEEILKLMEE